MPHPCGAAHLPDGMHTELWHANIYKCNDEMQESASMLCSSPMVLTPSLVAIIGPIVEPQGLSLRTTNSYNLMS